MSKPPKIDRKTLKTPDEFVRKGGQILGVLSNQKLHIVPVLIGVAVLLGFLYGYDWWDSSRSEKAWNSYYEATKEGVKDSKEQLKKVWETYPKTRAGAFAASKVADLYFDAAKKESLENVAAIPPSAEESVTWYSRVLDFRDLQPMEKQLLLIDRGAARELQKKWDEALGDYKSAADMGTELKGLALLGTARVLESKDDKAKALETYEKVSADFANTEYGKLARNHIRRLKNPALSNQKLGLS